MKSLKFSQPSQSYLIYNRGNALGSRSILYMVVHIGRLQLLRWLL